MTLRLHKWRNGQWSATIESLDPKDQSLWRMTKRLMRVPTTSPPGDLGGIALSDSDKAEVLVDYLETQFQPVTNPSVPAVIEILHVTLKS